MRTSDAVCVAYPRQCQVVLAEAVMKRGLQQRRGTKNPLRMNCEGCSVVSPGAFLMPSPLPRLPQEADHTLDYTFLTTLSFLLTTPQPQRCLLGPWLLLSLLPGDAKPGCGCPRVWLARLPHLHVVGDTLTRRERKKADVSIFVPEVQCGGWHKHKSCEGRAMKLFLTLESSRLEGS